MTQQYGLRYSIHLKLAASANKNTERDTSPSLIGLIFAKNVCFPSLSHLSSCTLLASSAVDLCASGELQGEARQDSVRGTWQPLARACRGSWTGGEQWIWKREFPENSPSWAEETLCWQWQLWNSKWEVETAFRCSPGKHETRMHSTGKGRMDWGSHWNVPRSWWV